ncbi:hypothetical protein ACRRTK_013192 [Alexandromys fortis]
MYVCVCACVREMAQQLRALAALPEDRFHSQHPHGGSQLTVPGDLTPSPDFPE